MLTLLITLLLVATLRPTVVDAVIVFTQLHVNYGELVPISFTPPEIVTFDNTDDDNGTHELPPPDDSHSEWRKITEIIAMAAKSPRRLVAKAQASAAVKPPSRQQRQFLIVTARTLGVRYVR